jgi:Transposase IS4
VAVTQNLLNLNPDRLPEFPAYAPPLPIQFEPARSLISHLSPIEIFQTLLTPEIVDEIVENTNSYAKHARQNDPLQGGLWTDVCSTDIWRFIGTEIYMDCTKKGRREEYFEPGERLHGIFTLRRWEQIHRYLTLRDTHVYTREEGESFAYRVEPISSKIKANIQASFVPASHLAIDEAMISFRGRSVHKVKLPKKSIKEGYKIWAQGAGGLTDYWIWHSREDGPEGVQGPQIFDRAGAAGAPFSKVTLAPTFALVIRFAERLRVVQ